VRRERTEDRKRLHKNTHNWARKRYRELIRRDLNGHIHGGRRDRLVLSTRAA
jgi:hypothetical protein